MNTMAFHGMEGKVSSVELVEVEWVVAKNGRQKMAEVENSAKIIPCDLALLAIGFLHPQRTGLIAQLGLELDNRGNVLCENYRTSNEKVFAAGDARRGQSLVVWAISEGREAARSVDEFLMGTSVLESKDRSLLRV